MNKAQKEVIQANLDDEKKTIRELKQVYGQARKDCEAKIRELSGRTDLENLTSIIYQKQYQEALKKQLDGICDTLNGQQFTTVADYLQKSYQNGYIGTMYDLHKQGIPITVPIDQRQVVKALQTDSKLSGGLYKRMGEDVSKLKTSIRAELSRGISQGKSWNEIATHIANGMNSPFGAALNRTILISRTEGHRVQQQAALDAQFVAKEKGADIVKQWCATLDDLTRPEHQQLDGQIVEVDEDFTVDGYSGSAPGMFGDPYMDCNCRCCILQRAKWGIDEDELETLYERANYFGLDKNDMLDEYYDKYLNLPSNADTMKLEVTPETQHVIDMVKGEGVKYREVQFHTTQLTEQQIIQTLAGGDRTTGSCASVAMSYLGQKKGLNVLDFRGGNSMEFFSSKANKKLFFSQFKECFNSVMAKNTARAGTEALKLVQPGKEYLLGVGRHMSVVRRTGEGVLQYLELQSQSRSGWYDFSANPRDTLIQRFGCSGRGFKGMSIYEAQLTNIDDFTAVSDLKEVLGYINTADDQQKKGVGGHER